MYYVTRTDKPGLIKIGTTKDLSVRLADLGRRGRIVKLLATEPGDVSVERKRHAQFAAMRMDGEWFTFAAPLVAHIHSLG